ncbi:hypothetical protein Y032_0120g923 [Ancylostoma ceylanicum]|uniref:Uncharacterized protein n=1 Tax=Ancylostoma ceylanicum TaxID=53326 RepID=A0A016TAQ0_9BILA|nr:hypothetical protein Y032_0120g923 [Ancylostoma ceylanicum]
MYLMKSLLEPLHWGSSTQLGSLFRLFLSWLSHIRKTSSTTQLADVERVRIVGKRIDRRNFENTPPTPE